MGISVFYIILSIAAYSDIESNKKEERFALIKRATFRLACFWILIGIGTGVVNLFSSPEDTRAKCTTDSDCLRKFGDLESEDYYLDDDDSPGGSGNSNPGIHSVDGYYRGDGTYVKPHIRSNPDGDPSNNLRP